MTAWIVTLARTPSGAVEAVTEGSGPDVGQAVSVATEMLRNHDLLAAFVIEEEHRTHRGIDGRDLPLPTRYRLAAQVWKRYDGTQDPRVYSQSESPWGSV